MSIPDYVKPGGDVIWDGQRVTVVAVSTEPSVLVTTDDGTRTMLGVSVISEAPPIVPTDPGWYLVPLKTSPSGVVAIELLGTGEWVDNTDGVYLDTKWIRERESFTRLRQGEVVIPRQVIVGAVMTAMQAGAVTGSTRYNDIVFREICKGLSA